MKVFTFRCEKNPKKSVIDAMGNAINTGKPDIRDDELVCDSMDSMLKLISRCHFEIFAAFIEYKLESLYDLAKVLNQDPDNVLRDVKVLESLGLIKLIPIKDGDRECLKPFANYDKIVFEFEPQKVAMG